MDNNLPEPMQSSEDLIDARALSKLKWRCRRGLLENDLLIERFFARHESRLTVGECEAMGVLMDLSDPDLLDLLLQRTQPYGALATPPIAGLLEKLRPRPQQQQPA